MLVCLFLCVSVYLSHAGIVLKQLDRSSWFLHTDFPWPMLRCVLWKLGYLQREEYFPLEVWLEKFCHGTPTVGRCDMNCSSRGLVFTAFLEATADGRCAWHVRYGSDSISLIFCQFVVDLLYNKLYNKLTTNWTNRVSLYSQRRTWNCVYNAIVNCVWGLSSRRSHQHKPIYLFAVIFLQNYFMH